MRPGQQNRRPRGRTNNNGGSNSSNNNGNNNNRGRQQNPLARSYESSGPDVKIRGNAQHIAERYAQLARDSLSAGDRVMAENYLQHAEHYNRIIAAALLQQAQFTEQQRREWDEEAAESDGEEGDENASSDVSAENGQPIVEIVQPQQVDGQNQNRDRNNFNNRGDRPERQERQPRPERNHQDRSGQDRNGSEQNNQDRNNQDRNNQDRNNQDRNNQERNNQERFDRQPRASFVAPVEDSQPVIEGTPVEFAGAEADGLARTLGLARSETRNVEVVHSETAVEAVAEEAPKVPRPRRAPRKVVVEVVEPAGDATGDAAGE